MSLVRRAVLLSTADRYAGLLINFAQMAAVSRLLTPAEIGVAAVGTAVMGLALSMREFASASYLMRPVELKQEEIRTSFTVLLLLTALVAGVFSAMAPRLAALYSSDQLSSFIRVVSLAVLVEALVLPLKTLIWRDMQFGRLAVINIGCTLVGSTVAICLAALGCSFMSLAWGWLSGSATTFALCLYFRPHLWVFRPTLRNWRTTVSFGAYSGIVAMLNKAYEMLPYIILGRMLSAEAVGQYNRATVVRDLSDRLVVAAVVPVSLPAFSAEARAGNSLEASYLRAFGYITVVQWPALILIAILAHPIVLILLGSQWIEVVPLVQIMAPAALFACPTLLTYPVLVAIGSIRDLLLITCLTMPASILVLYLAAPFGIKAVAASMFITVPFQFFVTLHFIKRHVPFTWGDVGNNIAKSALVTIITAATPLAAIAATGFRFDLSIGIGVLIGLAAAPGWLLGLWLARHPFLTELRSIIGWTSLGPIVQRLCGRGSVRATQPG